MGSSDDAEEDSEDLETRRDECNKGYRSNQRRTKNQSTRSLNTSEKTKRSKKILPGVLTDEENAKEIDVHTKTNNQDPNNSYVETVLCSKCKICGYLTTSSETINTHLESEHLDVLETSVLSSTSTCTPDQTSWFLIAQKHQIPLRCPLCINTFRGTHLSFKVHLMD